MNTVHLFSESAMSSIKTALKLLLVPVLIWTAIVVYGQCLGFFSDLIAIPDDKTYVYAALIAQGLLTAISSSVIYCYLLARIYGKRSVLVAFCMAFPVVALQVPWLSSHRSAIALGMTAFETFAYLILLVLGTWLEHKRLHCSGSVASRYAEQVSSV